MTYGEQIKLERKLLKILGLHEEGIRKIVITFEAGKEIMFEVEHIMSNEEGEKVLKTVETLVKHVKSTYFKDNKLDKDSKENN